MAACFDLEILLYEVRRSALDGGCARLLLNLVLLAKDALPRGGRIAVAMEGGLPRVTAWGEPASLADEARQVLMAGQPAAGPRGAQAELTRILAERLGARLSVAMTPDGLALSASPP